MTRPVEQVESLPSGPDNAKYLPQIAATCRKLGMAAEKVLGESRVPLVLGGDHSVAIGTVAGIAASADARNGKDLRPANPL